MLQHGEGAESRDVLHKKRFEDVITEKGSSTESRLKGLNTYVKEKIQFLFNKIPICVFKLIIKIIIIKSITIKCGEKGREGVWIFSECSEHTAYQCPFNLTLLKLILKVNISKTQIFQYISWRLFKKNNNKNNNETFHWMTVDDRWIDSFIRIIIIIIIILCDYT